MEKEKEKPTREEDDTAKTSGVNIEKTLVTMADEKVGEYIQPKLEAKRKYDGDGPTQPNEKKQGDLTSDFEKT